MGFVQCCGYFGSMLLMLISSVVFICLIIAYFPHIRTFFYKEGSCVITGTIYTVQYACACGFPGCKSFYPCMMVYAKVNSSEQLGQESQWPVMVFDDDLQQIWINNITPELEERCSIRIKQCDKDEQVNRDMVEKYRLEFALPGKIHKCYFDSSSLAARGVVLHKSVHWQLAFHVTFWPSLAFCSGAIMCSILCYSKRYRRRHRAVSTEEEKF